MFFLFHKTVVFELFVLLNVGTIKWGVKSLDVSCCDGWSVQIFHILYSFGQSTTHHKGYLPDTPSALFSVKFNKGNQ